MTGCRLSSRLTVFASLVLLMPAAAPTPAQVLPEYGAILKNEPKKGISFPAITVPSPDQAPAVETAEPIGDITFVRDGDVYTVTEDGTSFRRLTTDGRNAFPIWSPNHKHIAFSKAKDLTGKGLSSASIWVVTPDGKYRKPLGEPEPLRAVYPVEWLPDSKSLLVSVHHLDSDVGPELTLMTLDGKPCSLYEKWCEAGKKVGFLKDKANKQLWKFTPGQSAAFSPDGNRIVFTGSTESFVDAPRLDLFVMYTDGTSLHRLTAMPYIWVDCLRWHPKAERLLAAEEMYPKSGKHDAGIWLLNSRGSVQKKLLTLSAASFSEFDWSPNGSYIVFQKPDADYPRFESPADFPTLSQHSSVWAMKADGSGAYKLSDNACHPNWR